MTIPENILKELAGLITDALRAGDQVALPSFGTFNAVKTDEYTVTDPTTGRRTMMPPCIDVQFTPALKLVKAIKSGRLQNK